MIIWNHLNELTGRETYELFLLRQRVFMLEQECLYQDIDELDIHAFHCRYIDKKGQLFGNL